jgi:hypothetical protein
MGGRWVGLLIRYKGTAGDAGSSRIVSSSMEVILKEARCLFTQAVGHDSVSVNGGRVRKDFSVLGAPKYALDGMTSCFRGILAVIIDNSKVLHGYLRLYGDGLLAGSGAVSPSPLGRDV